MRITAAHITNFKRVEDVRVTPGADRAIILLGGRNRQGKSSTLDALTAAFGGKSSVPPDPVRHGAEEAEIVVELDGGELTVRRVIQPDGESALEVRDRLGKVRAPQTVLDKLVGTRFLDPLQFLALSPKDQRAQLMRVIGEAERIAELDAKRDRAFTRRTEVGRDLTRAQAELERLPADAGDAAEVPLDVLLAQRDAAVQARAAVDRQQDLMIGAERRVEAVTAQLEAVTNRIAQLEAELVQARALQQTHQTQLEARKEEARAATQAVGAARAAAPAAEAIAAIDRQITEATTRNREAAERRAAAARRAQVAIEVEQLGAEREKLTAVLATIDERKAAILSAAALPVEGLGLEADHITLGGVPLAQASSAERFRVALALAMAASPGLDDVWIRDAAVLDDEAVAAVAELAERAGKRVWLERVGTRDAGAIVISEGRVAETRSEVAA
jgi:DNA repair exonuclease SbcCD ATPase subunit